MNTKKALSILWLAVFFAALPQARAQEWRWANYWTGNDGYGTDYYNFVQQTAIDDDGNVYVLGSFGGNAVLHATDGDRRFSDIPSVVATNKQGWGIMKFDSLGNYVWSRIIKSSHDDNSAHWMELKGDRIYVSGDLASLAMSQSDWVCFLDTLVSMNRNYYTAFLTFDLDGNLVEQHLLYARSREYLMGVRMNEYLDSGRKGGTKFHRDYDGNTYVYVVTDFFGLEEDPYTIVVDDTVSYDIYLPGSTADILTNPPAIRNGMIYKFSPSWELLWHKRLVVESEGNATEYEYEGAGDSINRPFTPYFSGLSYDEDDNMYLVGYMQAGYYGEFGWVNHYPVYFYWDSTHYATMLDNSSSEKMPFIIKYNTDGDVVWCNQLYSRLGSPEESARSTWTGCCVDDRFAYIVGGGANRASSWLAFDSIGEYRLSRSNPLQNERAYFASYNKVTGQYVAHGIVPSEIQSLGSPRPTGVAVKNNQVFSQSRGAYGQIMKDIFLNRWAIDGTYLDADTIVDDRDSKLELGGVTIGNNGHVPIFFCDNSPVVFPNGIHLDCSTTQSNAIFAYLYDPRTMEPFPVPDNIGVTENIRTENAIMLYPNPVSDILTLQLHGSERTNNVEVYDLAGKLMGRYKGNTINVQDLPTGFYIINIVAGKNHYSAKFEKL